MWGIYHSVRFWADIFHKRHGISCSFDDVPLKQKGFRDVKNKGKILGGSDLDWDWDYAEGILLIIKIQSKKAKKLLIQNIIFEK